MAKPKTVRKKIEEEETGQTKREVVPILCDI